MWRTILGSLCAAVVMLAVTANAACMLVSPQAWFRLPGWIRLNGSLTEKGYGSGRGAVQVRLLGAILLTVIAWLMYHAMFR